jgi:uncharacterized protein YqhQ
MKNKSVGGQAIIEGVMMKNENNLAMSVRNQKGKIITKKEKLKPNKLSKIPIIRGITNLVEMLVLGMKGLVWSSNQSLGEKEELTTKEIIFVITISMILVVVFFIGLPFYLTKLVIQKGFWFNVLDGIIRITILVAYMLIISRMQDVKTLFQNHGAEHKTVNCYEANKKLTTQNVKKYSTLHPRCGTSFIIIVLLISIIIFSTITTQNWKLNIALRILLIPIIAGTSYEILKLSAKHEKNIIVKTLIQPGLWLQKITTKEPDNKQIEVAITALKTALEMKTTKTKQKV